MFDNSYNPSLLTESVILSKVKQTWVNFRRSIFNKSGANAQEFKNTSSFNGYIEDFVEDAKNAESIHDIEKVKADAYAVRGVLELDIKSAQEDVENKDLPQLQKNSIRAVLRNMITFKGSLDLIISRLDTKLRDMHKESIKDGDVDKEEHSSKETAKKENYSLFEYMNFIE
jgi:hypothetical protein